MQRTSFEQMPCPVAQSLERVGEWWSILILRDALYGLTRFDQFERSLGIASNVLARRLKALVEAGMLEKRRYQDRPPRYEYVLTDRGCDFRPVLWTLFAWGNRHLAAGAESVVLTDPQTGAAIDPVVVDAATGRPLTYGVRVVPGQGADERVRRRFARRVDIWRFAGAVEPEARANRFVESYGRGSMGQAATVEALMRDGEVAARPATTRRPSLKRIAMWTVAILGLAGAGLYARYWWDTGRFLQSTDDAYVGGDVTVLAPRVSGFVADVLVTDNQSVRAGELLLRIDDRDYRAALARTEAAVAGQDAALANLDATRSLQDAIVAQARADLSAADAEAKRTGFDYDRYRQLSSSQYASEQRFQQADADHTRATAAVDKARATLQAAQRQLAVIDTQKRQAAAAREGAIAERDMARLNLAYTEIRAPVDGVVGNRSARVGSYATPGSSLVSIVPARGLWVDANFKESQLASMRAGQRATIVADVLPGQSFTGHVESLAPATGAQFSVLPPENATGNFTKIVQRVPVRIRLDGAAADLGRLRPGLSVTASVDRRDDEALPAPQPAPARTVLGQLAR